MNEKASWEIGKGLGRIMEVNKKKPSYQTKHTSSGSESSFHWRNRFVEEDGLRSLKAKYECLVGLCYQCGRFGHEVKECSSQGSTQQTERPYGEWLKAGVQRKESALDRATYSPLMQQTAPESAAQTKGQTTQTTIHVETADVNGIKSFNDMWSL